MLKDHLDKHDHARGIIITPIDEFQKPIWCIYGEKSHKTASELKLIPAQVRSYQSQNKHHIRLN